ncbi:MAG: tetratricopeptide repeat protein [Brasilonema angustatum HA4187-MV1]|jgi:tetratricopeptide (TPR) repeat protein|nr:tetratricopeptide repeat protein [Brasilonema angustatum HA4187-MV1]
MLGRIWWWVKRLFLRLIGKSSRSALPLKNVPVAPPERVETRKPLTDAEHESLFLELLAGVHSGWSRGSVKGFLAAKKIHEAALLVWLRGFGERLLSSPASHQELAARMVQLGGLDVGEVGRVAGDIGLRLLPRKEETKGEGAKETKGGKEGRNENASPDNEAEKWYNLGCEKSEAGDFEGAIASYDKALTIQPDYYQAWFNRGNALSYLERKEEAIASYDKALTIQPDDYLAWFNRGNALSYLERKEEAIASYDKALTIQPDDYLAWFNRGVALSYLGRKEEAIASYDKALTIQPDDYLAWFNRGNALSDLGRKEEAIASYDKALTIQPDDYLAWFNRGNALSYLGRNEEAIASYDKALTIQPDDYLAWFNRGNALSYLGRKEEAIASYDKALTIQPDDYLAWFNRGVALSDLERKEEAIAFYDKALTIQPDDYQAWSNRGSALSDLERNEEAIASYDKALTIQPDDYQAWFNRGVALSYLERNEEAIASYDKALTIQRGYYQAWGNRGNALSDLERNEEAIASYDKALTIQRGYYQAWYGRGIAARSSPSCDRLLSLMSPIAKQNPDLNERDYHGALVSYEEGLKYCPQDTHPEGWGRLHQAKGNAHYWKGHSILFPGDYWKKAANSYNTALETLTATDYPEQRLDVLQDLIRVRLDLGETDKAEELQRHGTDVLQNLLDSCESPGKKRLLALKFAGFQRLSVDIAVQSGNWCAALELAEKGKNACLNWLLDEWYNIILFFKWQKILQLLIHPKTVKFYWHLSPTATHTFILSLLLYELNKNHWQEIQDHLLNSTTAIVYWHISPAALHTFILKHGAHSPIVITTPIETHQQERPASLSVDQIFEAVFAKCSKDHVPVPSPIDLTALLEKHQEERPASLRHLQLFEEWLKDWNQNYTNYRSKVKEEEKKNHHWRVQMPSKLENLKNILNIPAIEQHLQGITQLILIPHRDLHRFPLHALFSPQFRITYLPSAYLGIALKNIERPANGKNSFLSVEAPQSEGVPVQSFAAFESETINQLFDHSCRIPGNKATDERVKTELFSDYTIFHFTGHGSYNLHSPKQSALALTGAHKLTLEDIYDTSAKLTLKDNRPRNFSCYKLVSLAACETAITGNQTITTEYVGLVSGFLSMGVAQVVSTLWMVESAASALVMIEFYRRWQAGASAVDALAQATTWLKNLTVRQLKDWYDDFLQKLPEEDSSVSFIDTEIDELDTMEAEQKLYEHPYYWAAFTITGTF